MADAPPSHSALMAISPATTLTLSPAPSTAPLLSSRKGLLVGKQSLPWYKDKDARSVVLQVVLTGLYAIAEIVVGFASNSLALVSDAFHMLSDVLALIIGFVCVRISSRGRTDEMSYGWVRAEVLGGLMNGCFLMAVVVMMFLEAIQRFVYVPELVNGTLMMATAGGGLLINIIGMFLFGGHHGHSHGDHSHGGHSHGHSHRHSHGHDEETEVDEHNHEHGHTHGDHEEHAHDDHAHGDHEHGHAHTRRELALPVDSHAGHDGSTHVAISPSPPPAPATPETSRTSHSSLFHAIGDSAEGLPAVPLPLVEDSDSDDGREHAHRHADLSHFEATAAGGDHDTGATTAASPDAQTERSMGEHEVAAPPAVHDSARGVDEHEHAHEHSHEPDSGHSDTLGCEHHGHEHHDHEHDHDDHDHDDNHDRDDHDDHGHDHEHDHEHDHDGHEHTHGREQRPEQAHTHNNEERKEKHVNVNLHGMFLHVMGDALASVGVLVSGLLMMLLPAEWHWKFYFDPIATIFVNMLIVRSTLPLVWQTSRILLLAAPSGVSPLVIQREIEGLHGVLNLHQFHIWELVGRRMVATMHVAVANDADFMDVSARIKAILHARRIHYSTIQPEFSADGTASASCRVCCNTSNCAQQKDRAITGWASDDLVARPPEHPPPKGDVMC